MGPDGCVSVRDQFGLWEKASEEGRVAIRTVIVLVTLPWPGLRMIIVRRLRLGPCSLLSLRCSENNVLCGLRRLILGVADSMCYRDLDEMVFIDPS